MCALEQLYDIVLTDCTDDSIITFLIDCTDGSIILVGGNKPNEGRVEICVNGSWGTVCDSSFDLHDAEAACKRIGYSQLGLLQLL